MCNCRYGDAVAQLQVAISLAVKRGEDSSSAVQVPACLKVSESYEQVVKMAFLKAHESNSMNKVIIYSLYQYGTTFQ